MHGSAGPGREEEVSMTRMVALLVLVVGCSESRQEGAQVEPVAGAAGSLAAVVGSAGEGLSSAQTPSGGRGGEPGVAGGPAGSGGVEGRSGGAAGTGGAGGAEPSGCVPRPVAEACLGIECGSVPAGCGAMVECGVCELPAECQGAICVTPPEPPDPDACRRRTDVHYCELDLPELGYPETWVNCEQSPGDCVDAVEPLRSIGIGVAAGTWCCR